MYRWRRGQRRHWEIIKFDIGRMNNDDGLLENYRIGYQTSVVCIIKSTVSELKYRWRRSQRRHWEIIKLDIERVNSDDGLLEKY